MGFMSGIAISYKLNRRFTFRESSNPSFARYFVAYILALVAQLALLNLLIVAGITPIYANAFAIATIVFLNFFLVRKIAFR